MVRLYPLCNFSATPSLYHHSYEKFDRAVRNIFCRFEEVLLFFFLTWSSPFRNKVASLLKQPICFSSILFTAPAAGESLGLSPLKMTPLLENMHPLILKWPTGLVFGDKVEKGESLHCFIPDASWEIHEDISVCPRCEYTEGRPTLEQWGTWQDGLGQGLCKTFFRFQFEWVPRKCQVRTNPKFYNVTQPKLLRFTWFWVKTVQSTVRFIWSRANWTDPFKPLQWEAHSLWQKPKMNLAQSLVLKQQVLAL